MTHLSKTLTVSPHMDSRSIELFDKLKAGEVLSDNELSYLTEQIKNDARLRVHLKAESKLQAITHGIANKRWVA